MSAPVTRAPRLAYDDPASPHEMAGDCLAAEANLTVPVRTLPVAPRIALDDYREQPPTAYVVPVEVATMAGRLHLHFD